MDSALTKWRASESYRSHPKGIDMAGKRYRALVSDLARLALDPYSALGQPGDHG
jgi:hypothetical protein